jgi:3-oxoacyl-[acyl-carrier protein] reductase
MSRYSDEQRAEKLKKIPVGFFGEPKDIAHAVLFLADNEKARFIVGQTLLVDGGQLDDSAGS